MPTVTQHAPGTFCWPELTTTDQKEFYTRLFGWASQDDAMPGGGGDYTTFKLADQPVGGMMPMPPGVPKGAPSHWLSYFATADVDATASKTTSLGGRTLVPPTDIPGMGRFAVLQDSQGAVFAMVRFSM